MAHVLNSDEARQLLALCRAGKLYAVDDWIRSGKSLEVPAEVKRCPLEVAVEIGFHSLVELLAKHERNTATKNKALRRAVDQRRREIAELLIELGAEPTAVPFLEVLETWDPGLIRFFIHKGADLTAGSPFAAACGERIRKALRPMIDLRASRPDLAPALQEQADQALRFFAHEGDLKWVSLMLWAGANPRSKGRRLYDRDDPEFTSSAIEEACYAGHVGVLKKFKLSAETDDLAELLNCASALTRGDALGFLLGLGANPNDRPNGGSTSLYQCIVRMDWENFTPQWYRDPKKKKDRYDVRRSLECAEKLVRHGARLLFDDDSEVRSVARTLSQCDNRVIIDVFKLLTENGSASTEALNALMSRPALRARLEPEHRKLARLSLKLPDNGQRPKQPPFPHHMLARYNRDQLYEQVWSMPMQQLAKQYGISDVGLAKACKLMRIPLPGRGYWAKKAAGKPVQRRPPLPSIAPAVRQERPR